MHSTGLDTPRIVGQIEETQFGKKKIEISGLSFNIWKVIFQLLEPIEKEKLKGVSHSIAAQSIQEMEQGEELALTKKSTQNVIILRTYLEIFQKGALHSKMWGETYLNKEGNIEGLCGADDYCLIFNPTQRKFKQIYSNAFKAAAKRADLIETGRIWFNYQWDLKLNNTPFTLSGNNQLSLIQDQVITKTIDYLNAKAVAI